MMKKREGAPPNVLDLGLSGEMAMSWEIGNYPQIIYNERTCVYTRSATIFFIILLLLI